MVKKIIKRDGREVKFEKEKIYNAISKAVEATEEAYEVPVGSLVDEVVKRINEKYKDNIPGVEDVQDIVENVLIDRGYNQVAKNYIVYRANRSKAREAKTKLMKTLKDITFESSSQNDNKRENANINGDTAMGTMLKYGSEAAKNFYLTCLIDKKFSKAHSEGDIHIHDLDFYALTMTCCQIDLIQLFKDGFCTGHGFLREPNDIRSYSALACIAIQSNQNDQHGGQSVPNFDYAMAIGVRKTYAKLYRNNLAKMLDFLYGNVEIEDIKNLFKEIKEKTGLEPKMDNHDFNEYLMKELTNIYHDKEVINKVIMNVVKNTASEIRDATYQAMEAFIHNLNTMHSRAGAQVPFSSINYGTDTSSEGRLVIDCLLETTMKGLGNGETPIFPIQIFKVKEGINYNEGDPNYDLFIKSIKCSALRLFPNFSFIDAPFNALYYKKGDYNTEVAYMGCRTRVLANVYDPTREVTCGRGNLSFTSINLPRIALKHRNNIEAFMKELDEKCDLVINQLLERFEVQSNKKVYNFPFLMGEGIWLDSNKLKPGDSVKEVIKHGTLTIGFIGLAETLKALIGKHHGESKEAQELGLKIIGFMREKCDKAASKYKLNFSLIATPAEGLSGRFIKMDKKIFGKIEGITDQEFYTNSFHVPVYYPISIFKKIDIEAPYHELTNGGHISYVEVDGDIGKNLPAFEKIIRHMKEKGIGYGSVNHPLDRDPVCGYNGIINNECPCCHRKENEIKFERIRRITGYLVGTLDRFNDAKRAEVEHRVKHSMEEHYEN